MRRAEPSVGRKSTQIVEYLASKCGGNADVVVAFGLAKENRVSVVVGDHFRLDEEIQQPEERPISVVVRLEAVVASQLAPWSSDFEEEPHRRPVEAPRQSRPINGGPLSSHPGRSIVCDLSVR